MVNLQGSIAAILLLLAANGFFVAAEFALVKARGFRIGALADGGSRTARLTLKIQHDLEAYLAACQLGITMASLGLGWVGEPAVEALLKPAFNVLGLEGASLHTAAFLAGFLLFSSLHIVIGEQVPKTYAIRKPEPVSLWTAYPLQAFYLVSWPLNWVLKKATSGILSLFGVAEATHGEVLTDAEIRNIINTSEEHGGMDARKAAMLHNLFEFDNRTVEQIMVPRSEVDVLLLDAPWEQNRAIILETGHSRFPLLAGDTDVPVSVVLTKDLFNALLDQRDDLQRVLREVSREPLLVPETQPIGKLFEAMRQERSHMALVIDEYGGFAGIATMEDLLEEIVGEIADELDVDEPSAMVRRVGDHWETDGLTPLTDLERTLDIEFPDDLDANTVSGLFMERLDRMPVTGDEIEAGGYRFLARKVDHHRVEEVEIRALAPACEETEDTGTQNDR